MPGGDLVTVLGGTPVLAMPRAWQQCQRVSTVSPPRSGMLLCWGPAGAGTAQSKALGSVLSQLRDLEDMAAHLEKVLSSPWGAAEGVLPHTRLFALVHCRCR